MKYALIENGQVSNIIEWDGESDLGPIVPVPIPDGALVDIGTKYDGAEFVPENPPEPAVPVAPTSVTMRQARLALLAAGLLDDVQAAIDAMPSPDREAAQIEWDYAATVDRESAFMQQMAGALNLDADMLDGLFTDAASR